MKNKSVPLTERFYFLYFFALFFFAKRTRCTFLYAKEKYEKKRASVPLDRLVSCVQTENVAAFAPRT